MLTFCKYCVLVCACRLRSHESFIFTVYVWRWREAGLLRTLSSGSSSPPLSSHMCVQPLDTAAQCCPFCLQFCKVHTHHHTIHLPKMISPKPHSTYAILCWAIFISILGLMQLRDANWTHLIVDADQHLGISAARRSLEPRCANRDPLEA